MCEFACYLSRQQSVIAHTLQEELKALPEGMRLVAWHILESGGKRLRPAFVMLFASAFGRDDPAVLPLACALELLHSATLLHDDIMDHAALRRGRPAAHTVFGAPDAVLAGDALLALSNMVVSRYGNIRLSSCLAEATMRTACGQMLEMENTGNAHQSLEEYITIIEGKTAWMIRAACQMGAIFADAGEREIEAAALYGTSLGIAFQMVDDALDFSISQETGKPVAGDLREYKCTLPLFLYLRRLDSVRRGELAKKFHDRALTEEDIAGLSSRIRELGLDAEARKMAAAHLDGALRSIAPLPPSSAKRILCEAVYFVRHRDV